MNLDEIEDALAQALRIRSPVFAPETSPRQKIGELEDYMLMSANLNGDLVAARHWLRALRARLADEWEQLTGWEVATTKPRAKLTAADIQRAKVRIAPERFEAGRKAKRLAESVDDQIARLEREERVCSRAYTMISGA